MSYITPSEAAERKDVSTRRIQVLAKAGRIPGAKQLANGTWLIPVNFRVKPSGNKKRRQLEKLAA